MISNCLLHNSRTCGKRRTIQRYRDKNKIKIVFAFDWNTTSDNIALIHELVHRASLNVMKKYQVQFDFQTLGGKDGSIFCDICRQIQEADIALFDISTHNLNVILELGLAIGSGAYAFMLRSTHYKKPKRGISDLNGILEYRFTRRQGQLKFEADFERSLKSKLNFLAKKKIKS
jgi:hypothetical protein